MSENTTSSEYVVLRVICAFLATFGALLSMWPNANWLYAGTMTCIATGLWSTVIQERAKRRARNKRRETDSDDVAVEPKFMFTLEVVCALAYTICTVIWVFADGFWWVPLAILCSLYWYNLYKHWRHSIASI